MSVTVPTADDMLIVKGPLVSVLTNVGAGAANHTFKIDAAASGMAANTQVLDVVQCESFTTDGSGNLDITLSDGMPRVMMAQADAGNVCDGYVKPTTGGNSGSGGGSGSGSGNGAGALSVGLGAVVVGVMTVIAIV
jgi:alpha-amylase